MPEGSPPTATVATTPMLDAAVVLPGAVSTTKTETSRSRAMRVEATDRCLRSRIMAEPECSTAAARARYPRRTLFNRGTSRRYKRGRPFSKLGNACSSPYFGGFGRIPRVRTHSRRLDWSLRHRYARASALLLDSVSYVSHYVCEQTHRHFLKGTAGPEHSLLSLPKTSRYAFSLLNASIRGIPRTLSVCLADISGGY